ncbi:MAG: hypothetical protein Q9221_007178 [Calogaya cf. arnoldii]
MSDMTKARQDSAKTEGGLARADTSESSKNETDVAVPAAVFEDAVTKSRSRQRSGDDAFIPLQGHRTNSRDASRYGGPSSKARALVNTLRPKSHHGGNGSNTVEGRSGHGSSQDDDDDEIPLHMWERNGEIVLRIPWLAQSRRDRV